MEHKDVEMFVYFGRPGLEISSKIPKLHYLKTDNEEIHYSSTPQEGFAYISTEGCYWLVSNTDIFAKKIITMRSLDEFKNMPGTVISAIDESTYNKYLEPFSTVSVERVVFTLFGKYTYCVLSTYEDDNVWNIYCANKFLSVRESRTNSELHYLLRGQYKRHINLEVGEHDIKYPINHTDDEIFNNTLLGVDYTVLNEVVEMYEYSISEFEKLQKLYKVRYL